MIQIFFSPIMMKFIIGYSIQIMNKFFNKDELVIIAIIMFLFEFNAFCEMASGFVVWKDQVTIVSIFIVIFSLLYMFYVLKLVIMSRKITDVNYEVRGKLNVPCSDYVLTQGNILKDQVSILKENCAAELDPTYLTVYKMIGWYVIVTINIIVLLSIFASGEGNNSYLVTERLVRTIPIMATGFIIFLYSRKSISITD